MSATLLSALFCNTLVHPQRNVDFASYVPQQLWDGADVFADPYRWVSICHGSNVGICHGSNACLGLSLSPCLYACTCLPDRLPT